MLPPLLRRIICKHYGDFQCLNSLLSSKQIRLESHKGVFKNKELCNIIMPSEDTKILEINQYQKSDKAPIVNYAHVSV